MPRPTEPTRGSNRSRTPEPSPTAVSGLIQERLDLAEELSARGLGGSERRAALSRLVIGRLVELWKSIDGPESGAALAAVGSLGRLDSGPASDLDLILLHDNGTWKDDDLAAFAQRLWYPIWDADIPLDHSVRSLGECRDVASRDPVAAAGLLDLAPIVGDEGLVEAAQAAIRHDWRVTARRLLPELLEGAHIRAERFGELAYLTEPNLKESRGGLRDYTSLHALTATWLADRPHGDVDDAALYLLDVRDELQTVTGGPHVVLSRRAAPTVAARLGYRSEDDLLAALSDLGRRIAYALDVTERAATRVLDRSRPGFHISLARHHRVPPKHKPIAEGLITIGSDLALAPDAPLDDAVLPLRVASVAASTGLNPTPRLLDAVGRTPDLPDPWPDEALSSLLTLLGTPNRLFPVWEALDLAGAVVRWLPEWEGIRNRPQRSPVHRYTVDRHSVETVIQVGILLEEGKVPSIVNRDLLLLSALFHDLGKRPGADDHSEAGAALVPGIAARLGIEPEVARDLEALVRYHLLLAELATSENAADPATVDTLLDALDRRADLFETLRALTEADAIAAGPKAWRPWRRALVDSLTDSAREALSGKAANRSVG